jgi:hypothetical protein
MMMHRFRPLALALLALPVMTQAAPDLFVQSIYVPGQANPGDAVAAGMEIAASPTVSTTSGFWWMIPATWRN